MGRGAWRSFHWPRRETLALAPHLGSSPRSSGSSRSIVLQTSGMAQLVCEHDHHMGALSVFSTLPLASAPWMSLSILLFLHLQGSDVRANARFPRARERLCVHVCVSVRVSVCVHMSVRHVCETASELGPVDFSAAGTQSGAPVPASLLLVTLSAGPEGPRRLHTASWSPGGHEAAAEAFGLVLSAQSVAVRA